MRKVNNIEAAKMKVDTMTVMRRFEESRRVAGSRRRKN
jgi:hypothetical protein